MWSDDESLAEYSWCGDDRGFCDRPHLVEGRRFSIKLQETFDVETVRSDDMCLITKKTLVAVAYHFNIEGLLELNAEAPIIVQVRHVAQTSIVVAPVALLRETFIVR